MSAPLALPEAYEEGAQAYLDGYSDDVNPYHFGTALYTAWEDGWDSEFNKDYRGRQQDGIDKMLDDPRRGQARELNRR